MLALAPEGCVVTDVGSTKSAVCAAADGDGRFIGGHPICGAETRGPERANAELFEGATWFLTPTAGTGPELLRTVHGFVTSLGARPVAIDAGAHDRLVAVTSHLPHALANVLLNQAGATRVDGHDPLQAAGGSLRDMTRIAGANPRIWVDIFLDNREAVVAALGEHRRRIEQLETALTAEDGGQLARWIAEAAGNRRRMLATAHGDPGALQRLRVHLPDRPGVLAGIFQALGAERINVEDFEMDHLSTDRGGTLTVVVAGEDEAERAADPARGAGVRRRRGARDRRMRVEPLTRLVGHIAVPGDKSISHRAVLLGALCDGETRITGFGRSADTEATIEAVRALGITVYEHGHDTLHVFGKGLRGLVVAGPADRLRQRRHARPPARGHPRGPAGAAVRADGRRVAQRPADEARHRAARPHGRGRRDGRRASAARYRGPAAALDHLRAARRERPGEVGDPARGPLREGRDDRRRAGADARPHRADARGGRRHRSRAARRASPCSRPERLELGEIEVPGDFSSAAPFIVAATLVPGSELHIHGVNLNPRRTGLLTILERMGGRVTVYNRRRIGGERAGDLEVRSAELVATTVLGPEVPLAIDELPLFALAASCAHGNSRLRGAEELRAKESDRVEATVDALRALGQHVLATEDGFRIRGVPTRPRGGRIDSRGDHRIAMLGAVAALDSQDGVEIEDAECVAVSFPGFFELLDNSKRRQTGKA